MVAAQNLSDRDIEDLLGGGCLTRPKYERQADAWAAGQYILQAVASDGKRHFHAYSAQEARERDAEALAAEGLEVVERVDGSRPAFPCIDVDGGPDLSDEDLDRIAEVFRETLSAFGAEDTSVAAYGYDSTTRRSRHLVAQGVRAPNGATVRDIARDVKEAVPEHLRDAVDILGGSKSFGLRLPHCAKKGDASKVLRLLWSDTPDPSPWIQDGSEDCQLLDASEAAPAPTPAPAAATDIEAFATRIAEGFPHFARGDDVGGLPTYDRLFPVECASCGRTHDRAGAYVSRSAETGTLFLNCRRADLGAEALLAHATEANDTPMPEEDVFDASPTPDVLADQRYNADAFAAEIAGSSDLYVRAPWKTGKTVFASKIILRMRESNAGVRVLVITCRKTLSSALVADFGATDYRQIKGDFTEELARRHPVTVWQLESLRRIPSELPAFDLVVVDEPGADFAHVFQPNANAKARGGLSKARALISKARRIYVSDNDLTAAHVAAFQAIRQNKQARVLVNEFKSWEGVSSRVTAGKAAPTVVRQRLFDFLDAQAESRKAGRPWTGCVVPCHSRKVANGIAEEVRQRYGPEGVKLYTSESDQHEKAEDFADATRAWADALAVVYTGSLSVGVSATTDHVSHCFAFFTGGNAGVAQSCQMLFRAREIRVIEIAFDGQPTHGLPQSPEQLFDWATHAKNRGAIPDQFRADLMPEGVFGGLQTQEDPDALAGVVNGSFEGRAWVCDQLERHRSARWFLPRMVRTLGAAGCAVTVDQVGRSLDKAAESVGISAENLKATNEAAAEATASAEQARDEMAAKEFTAALADFEDQVAAGATETDDSRMLTAPEIQGKRALHAVRTYVDGGGLDFHEVSTLGDEERAAWLSYHAKPRATAAYRALTSIVRETDQIRAPDNTGGVQTATSSSSEACAVVRRVFAAIGCTPALMTGEDCVVAVADLIAPSPALVDAIGEIDDHSLRVFSDTHAARRRKALAKGYTAQKVAGSLNIALQYVGAELRPTFRTERDRNQRRNAQGYAITWQTHGTPADPAPAPIPGHPYR